MQRESGQKQLQMQRATRKKSGKFRHFQAISAETATKFAQITAEFRHDENVQLGFLQICSWSIFAPTSLIRAARFCVTVVCAGARPIGTGRRVYRDQFKTPIGTN
jgi:hypothetical protein